MSQLTYTCNYNLQKCNLPSLKSITIHQAVEHDLDYDDKKYGVEYRLAKPLYPIELNKFDSLEQVSVYNMPLTDANQLHLPENIKSLSFNFCRQLLSLSGLDELKKLKHLYIGNCNNIQSFEFLKELDHVEWKVLYMGKEYNNLSFSQLISHPKEMYYPLEHWRCTENEIRNHECFLPPKVFPTIQAVLNKLHKKATRHPLSRQEFLNLLPPVMEELYAIDFLTLDGDEDNFGVLLEELDFEILEDFLINMGQLAGHDFDRHHVTKWLYKLYQ